MRLDSRCWFWLSARRKQFCIHRWVGETEWWHWNASESEAARSMWLLGKREEWYVLSRLNWMSFSDCVDEFFTNTDPDTIEIHSVAFLENQMLSSMALDSQGEYLQWVESYVAKVWIIEMSLLLIFSWPRLVKATNCVNYLIGCSDLSTCLARKKINNLTGKPRSWELEREKFCEMLSWPSLRTELYNLLAPNTIDFWIKLNNK